MVSAAAGPTRQGVASIRRPAGDRRTAEPVPPDPPADHEGARRAGGGAVGLTTGVLMRATGVGLLVFGAIVLFIGLRISLRASRYEMAEHWFRFGLWATGTGIALQTIGVLVTIRAK
jgi:hypothetical protein